MHNFYVIDGKKLIDYKPRKEHYTRALARFLQLHPETCDYDLPGLMEKHYDTYKKCLYLTMKFIEKCFDYKNNYSEEDIETYFTLISFVDDMIGLLTPHEFVQMFPIAKAYDGEKYSVKDYFYTMEYIKNMDINSPIGKENASKFLFEYWNWDINKYMVAWMEIVNRMHQLQGGKDMMLEFFEEQGHPLHTMHQDGDFMVDDETGERYKIKKPENKIKKLFTVL